MTSSVFQVPSSLQNAGSHEGERVRATRLGVLPSSPSSPFSAATVVQVDSLVLVQPPYAAVRMRSRVALRVECCLRLLPWEFLQSRPAVQSEDLSPHVLPHGALLFPMQARSLHPCGQRSTLALSPILPGPLVKVSVPDGWRACRGFASMC